MKLNTALSLVAAQLGLDARQLIEFAAEDKLPGYQETSDPHDVPYRADGQFLYALVRALQPLSVLEIGTAQGGSARHILEALDKNGRGGLFCVDINPEANLDAIPAHLQDYVALYHENSDFWLDMQDSVRYPLTFGFIHEDGAHSIHNVQKIYNHLPRLMKNGGVIVSHDTALGVGNDVRTGIEKAGFTDYRTYLYDESPCGFSVMEYMGSNK